MSRVRRFLDTWWPPGVLILTAALVFTITFLSMQRGPVAATVTFAMLTLQGNPAVPTATSCDDLSAAAKRGKLLFRRGVSGSGAPLRGLLGGGPAALTGREAACAGCHTPSGAGAEEGGLEAPPITPEHLFAEAFDRGDRSRRAYDDRALALALREGKAPSGREHALRRLGMAMPRYPLAGPDLDDLIAYLHCVGHDRDPGVSEAALKLGAALPLSGPLATVGADVQAVLAASFADVQAEGGIFRRRLDLVVEDSHAGGVLDEAGATDRLAATGVLALVGNVWSRGGPPAERAGVEEIPLVAPVGPLDPGSDVAGPRQGGDDGSVFYVHAGPDALARIAVKQLAGPDGSRRPHLLVAHAHGAAGEAWLRGARAEVATRGLPDPETLAFQPGRLDREALVDAVQMGGSTVILLWGTAADLTTAAAVIERLPGVSLDVPGHLLGAAPASLPVAVRDRVFFIESVLGGEAHGPAVADFQAFLRRHDLPPRHLAVQARARVAALVLIEALKRSGARVTRDGLVAALETFRDFDAGLVPPLSYGKGRRLGVLGASLLRLDAASGATVRASPFIEVAP